MVLTYVQNYGIDYYVNTCENDEIIFLQITVTYAIQIIDSIIIDTKGRR